jgi:hypothetical protein
MDITPIPIARRPFDPEWPMHDLKAMDKRCPACNALHWADERLSKSSEGNPKFGMCCYNGKILLPTLHQAPQELYKYYMGQDPVSKGFREHIRTYNDALSMTSVGRKVDRTVNDGRGPWVFKLHGELSHRIGTLLPEEGGNDAPKFAQLYIYDSDRAYNYRMANPWNSGVNGIVLRTLQDMLYNLHPAVQLFEQAYEKTANMSREDNCRISLHFDKDCDWNRYNSPDATVKEIAVILPGDGDQIRGSQDIILFHRYEGGLQRISDCHPLYPSLHYVLLFPTGQLGWHPNIPKQEIEEDGGRAPTEKEKYVSLIEFLRYRLHIRPIEVESNHLFLAGKLFQQYVVESWAVAEQNRLNWIRLNQTKLRVEVYKGIADAVNANDGIDWAQLGKRYILPSSFSGSTRNMQQHLQDALAINRYYGGGDLFITMTANPEWPEIKAALLHKDQIAPNRPDLIVRVFHAKLKSLIGDIKYGALGDWAAHLYTIEFQKRGLPHAHIILFLKPHAKLRTSEDIDRLMSSEFPTENNELLELIQKLMVHTPCGEENPTAPCMRNGFCSKGFPKPFREETSVTEDSYACTKRHDTGQTYMVRGKQVNNQWVVCYNKYLIWKYRCHINIESIASVKAIKYIYKYVYKGHDRATMEFGRCTDEIKQYLDARYVSSCEALWRTYMFHMQEQVPAVVRLAVHLPEEHTIVFNAEQDVDLQEALDEYAERNSTLTAWFKANKEAAQGSVIHNTLYQDFPSIMVWNKNRKWTLRKEGFAIGRMYYAHPTSGERFYVRLLLTIVKGAKDFDDLRTFEGILYPTFKAACIAHGLLEDDSEWHQCLQEAKDMQMGHQLRHLFVTIMHECAAAKPEVLWREFKQYICDDLKHQLSQKTNIIEPSDEEAEDYGLYLINQLLSHFGRELKEWGDMPKITKDWPLLLHNHLIQDEHHYDPVQQYEQAEQCIANLNPDQHAAFERITSAIINKTGEIFFLHGPGGTGKTYLYNTLCYHLRAQGKIVLCVASSGIAALLLQGGRTAHSTFKIPIPCHESSVCNIKNNSALADLIRSADLIIWDEAPMQHKYNMEAVDHTFRDLCESEMPFGGHTIVFGGDFQQILPVIIKGGRAQVVGACLQRSHLWGFITVLHLHQNMRLDTHVEAEADFAKWQQDVGQGRHTDQSSIISLPDYFKCRENTVASLIDEIYPNLETSNHPAEYFAERTILSSLNADVDSINKQVLLRFPGESHIFHSADSIPTSEQSGGDDPMLDYPVEYLNEINCSGLPLAKLELKCGCPIMILRNINPRNGICNGSRGILTRISSRILEVQLLTGGHIGKKVLIPRISNVPTDEQVGFKFIRRQFPVRVCFAMTINKSQGQTVRYVGLDLRRPVFSHGQFYVGISRVTSVWNIKAIWEEKERQAKTKNVVYNEVLLRHQ